MSGIGGYFELHLDKLKDLPYRGIYFNLGRSAFEYVLRARKVQRVWLPEFNCPTLIPAAQRAQTEICWYQVDEQLYPKLDPAVFSQPDTMVLIVNYFGLRSDLLKLYERYKSSIIWDFAQAFFCHPPSDEYLICYSPRKLFGIPDGGILCGAGFLREPIGMERSQAYNKMARLVKRYDTGAESGYMDFQLAEEALSTEGPMLMSNFSQAVLSSMDFGRVAATRLNNYQILHHSLKNINRLVLPNQPTEAPLVYPLMLDGERAGQLRQHLIKNKIFVARYWPFDGVDCISESTCSLSNSLLPLPIDQRYCQQDMQRVIDCLNEGDVALC